MAKTENETILQAGKFETNTKSMKQRCRLSSARPFLLDKHTNQVNFLWAETIEKQECYANGKFSNENMRS
jgi:hypothetical protein